MMNLCDEVIFIVAQYCMFTPHQILFFYQWKKYLFSDLFLYSKHICESTRNYDFFNKIINGANKNFRLTFKNIGYILFVTFNYLKRRETEFVFSEFNVNKCLRIHKKNLINFLKKKISIIQKCSYIKYVEREKENICLTQLTFINNSSNKNDELIYFKETDIIIRCFFCSVLCKSNDYFNCCIRCKYIHFYDKTDPEILSQLTFYPIYE